MSDVKDLNRNVQLHIDDCCVCGVVHAIPQVMWENCNRNGGYWYCPNGHHIGWDKKDSKSVNDKLRSEIAQLQSSVAYERNRVESEKRKTAAAKGSLTKMVKRIENGVCPCCHRSFQNLKRHIANKHPRFIEADVV